LQMQEV